MKLTHTFKNSLYLLCLILVGYTAKSQTTVTIGDQNTNYISYYTPFNNYYNYSWADNVYLSSEIGHAGTITQIAFYVYEGTNINMSSQSIYMRTTSATSFTNSAYPGTTGFTSVYSGSINYVWNGNSGWQTITLTTPFVYDGTSSLEVLCLNNSGAYTNNFEYFNVTTGYSTNRSKLDYYDASFPSTCRNCGSYTMLSNCQLTLNCSPSTTVTPTTATVCLGSGTNITASGASTYTWSPSSGLNTTSGATVTATPTTTTTYSVASTNSASCVQTNTVSITVNALPSLTITPSSATICSGTSTTLTGSGATSYTWSPGTGLNTTTSATVTASPTVTTTYTLTGKNSSNCVNTKTITVTVNPVNTITVTPSSAAICTGSSSNLVASGAQSYVWSPSTGLNTTTSATVTANPTVTTTYTVTGNCNQTTTIAVTVNALPTLTITPSSATICSGSSSTLTASGASTYSWSPSSSLSSSTGATVTATPTATTTYTLTGTNANGCNNTKTAVVTVNPLPTLTITPNSPTICAGASTTLTASGASTYSWSPATGLSATTGASVTANPTVTTTYTITATNSNGCIGTQTATVNINATPTLTVTPNNPTICNAGSATMTASGASTYSWSPSTGLNTTSGATVISNASSSTIYTVSGTGSDGCLATATATVSLSQVNAGTALASGGSNLCSNAAVALSLSTANVNQVGTGTNSSNNYPFNGFYNYSWSDVIYLQSDLGSAGTLTSLSFYVNNGPSNFVMNSQNIYIRTTTATSFTNSTYPGTSGFTQVFNGTITYNGTGWKTITLNTPFTYDGTSNLEILYENHDGSWGNGFPTFNYTSGYSANRLKRDYEDASFPSSCYTCGAYAYVPNTQFTFTRTLDNFVKWQSSTDNINYTDISGGTSQSFNTTANTSAYYRAQMSNGTCTAPSAPAYYVTNNNYYVNDNSTTDDKFCSAIGNSANDGRDRSRPNTTVNYILTTYTLGPCDTIFVDAGNYTQEVDIYYPEGGNSSGWTTIHGAGIGKTVFTAPASGLNFYMYQPDYWKIEGFTMNSTQSYANVLMYESTHNMLANNKMTHSAYSNVQVFGDNLSGKSNQFLYNNISNSSTNGNAIDVEGSCDSTLVQGDTITMSNSSSQDAMIFYTYNDGNGNIYYPSHNNITQNVVSAYSYGVSLYGYDHPISTFTVSNNKITLNSSTTSDGAPIWLDAVGSNSSDISYIYNNRLIGGNNGIYIGATANYEEIYNNYVSNNNYGVYVSSSTSNNAQLYFNSFYNSITNLYFVSSANSAWKVKNNILYTTNTTATNANIFVGNATTFADCNYNLFYAPSGASTARFNSTNYTSLAAWQAVTHSAATSHGDENSVSGNPSYTGATTNNLDIPGGSPAAYKGVSISAVTADIYGLNRTTTPSIGADEPSEASSSFYFRSAQTGNWNQLSTWQASPDGTNWIAADIIPTFLQKSITIQTGHVVTITAPVTIDEVTVNGTLVLGNYAGNDLTINNGNQADLTINGVFQDNGPDSLIWTPNASWILGTAGTLQISSNTTGNGWQNNYQGGISTIPSTANWILNKTGTMNPSLYSDAGMYYPNLIIQNNSGSSWTTVAGSNFSGSAPPLTIKGNFDIGGTGANPVVFVNQNTNSTPILVQGNLTVETGSSLQNNGTGFNIQSNLTFNGSFTGTKNLFFSGINNQTITGAALSEISNLNLNKASGTFALGAPVGVDNTLTLTSGYIISTSTNLLTLNNGATVSGGSSSSFVAGPMKKIGNLAFTFPTGKGTNYQPIGISAPTNTTDAFTAEYINVGQNFGTAKDSTIDSLNTCEYWNLNETVGNSSVSVTAGWNANSCLSDSASHRAIAHWNGAKWINDGQASANGNRTSGSVVSGSTLGSIFGPITIVSSCNMLVSITSSPLRTSCHGSAYSLTANPSGFPGPSSYSWSGNPSLSPSPGNVNNISVFASGTYSVTISGGRGGTCKAKASIPITVNVPPSFTVNSPSVCLNNSISITASNSSITYSWTPQTGLTLNSSTGISVNATPSLAQTYTVSVTGTDGNNCSNTQMSTVTVNANPVVTITPTNTTICSDGSTTLTASGATTYVWSSNAGSATTNSVSLTPTITDTYTVTGTSSACSATTTAVVTVNANPVVTITPTNTTICAGGTTTLTASGATTYVWSSNAGSATTNSVSLTPTITDTYTVTGTSSACSATTTAVVTVIANPVVTITPTNTIICAGGSTTLTASGATTYVWSSNAGSATTNSVSLTPTITDTYTVTGTSSACSATTTAVVTVNANPVVTITPTNTTICSGGSTTLTASGATTYVWSSNAGSATTNSVSLTPTITDTYTVTGTSSACSATTTAVVTVNANPVAAITLSPNVTTITSGQSIMLQGGPVGSQYLYNWLPGSFPSTDQTITVSPLNTTTYSLTVTDNTSHCSSSITTVIINVVPQQYAILKRQLDGGFYQLNQGKLYFTISGEYKSANLNYKIYDYKRAVRTLTSPPSLVLSYADNRYFLDLQTLGFSISDNGSVFTLEVTNEKNEKFLLKFKY